MSITTSPPQRPVWLVTSLATASAILVYRMTGGVTGILFSLLPMIDLQVLQYIVRWELHVHLVLGLLVAVLCVAWQHRFLAGRPLRASYWALSVFVLLAVLPLRLEIRQEPVSWEDIREDLPAAADATPVSLKCKVIAGEEVRPQAVFDQRNVTRATPEKSLVQKGYVVRLQLDSPGQERLGEVTDAEIGKTLGFWIDGELVCVGKIHQPIASGVIYVAGDFFLNEPGPFQPSLTARE